MADSQIARARRAARRAADRIRWRGRIQTVLAGPAAGLRMQAGPASADYTSGTNEEPVQALLASLLVPGDTFVDIGANVGFFSMLAARLVGPSGRVIAFEAVTDLADRATANARLNGFDQLEVHAIAIGATNGTARLSITTHSGGASLSEEVDPSEVVTVVDVPVVDVASLIEDGTIPLPDVVKIDVEGYELPVLEGMISVFELGQTSLIIELDAPNEPELNHKSAAVIELLDRYGYQTNALPSAYPDTDWEVAHLHATPR